MSNYTKNVAPLPDGLDVDSGLALAVIVGYKSHARAEYYKRANLGTYAPDSPPIARLVALGLATVNRAGAIALTDTGTHVGRKTLPARYFYAVGASGIGRPGYGDESPDEARARADLNARTGGRTSAVVRSV